MAPYIEENIPYINLLIIESVTNTVLLFTKTKNPNPKLVIIVNTKLINKKCFLGYLWSIFPVIMDPKKTPI